MNSPRGRTYRDVIGLLTKEHTEIEDDIQTFEALESEDAAVRQDLAVHICALLSMHLTLEEEIFHLMTRHPIAASSTMDFRALKKMPVHDHSDLRRAIDRAQEIEAHDTGFDSAMQAVFELARRHVTEQEGGLFPTLRDSGLNLVALGAILATRKRQLLEV